MWVRVLRYPLNAPPLYDFCGLWCRVSRLPLLSYDTCVQDLSPACVFLFYLRHTPEPSMRFVGIASLPYCDYSITYIREKVYRQNAQIYKLIFVQFWDCANCTKMRSFSKKFLVIFTIDKFGPQHPPRTGKKKIE